MESLSKDLMNIPIEEADELYHWGIKGMKWGVRRYQNKDGSLTDRGLKRYNKEMEKLQKEERVLANKRATAAKMEKLENARKRVAEQKAELKKKPTSKEEEPKQKSLSEMTNEEVAAYKQRIQNEKDIADAKAKIAKAEYDLAMYTPKEKTKIEKFADGIGGKIVKQVWDDVAKQQINDFLSKALEPEKPLDTLGKLKKEADIWKQRENISRSKYNSWLNTYKKDNEIISDKKDDNNNGQHDDENNKNKKKNKRNKGLKHSIEEIDSMIASISESDDDIRHYGILGMKWGVHRFYNADGSRTAAGKARENAAKSDKRSYDNRNQNGSLSDKDMLKKGYLKKVKNGDPVLTNEGHKFEVERRKKLSPEESDAEFRKIIDDENRLNSDAFVGSKKEIKEIEKPFFRLSNEIENFSGNWYFEEGVSKGFKEVLQRSRAIEKEEDVVSDEIYDRKNKIISDSMSYEKREKVLKEDAKYQSLQKKYDDLQAQRRSLSDDISGVILNDLGYRDTPDNRKLIKDNFFY